MVAIVGENGAGKSTFLKLLMGLYKNYEGEIIYISKDKKELSGDSVNKNSTAVFQKYQRYKTSIKNNVFLHGQIDIQQMHILMDEVNLSHSINIMKEGYNTCLSKEFGGIDISGGQWQRIAIARGMTKDVDILCLDEPTSAIDPMEESALYRLFEKISHNKFSFIVTHRLGMCKIADRIIVIDKGKIVEDGPHHELMEKKGKYYNMYMKQRDLFVK